MPRKRKLTRKHIVRFERKYALARGSAGTGLDFEQRKANAASHGLGTVLVNGKGLYEYWQSQRGQAEAYLGLRHDDGDFGDPFALVDVQKEDEYVRLFVMVSILGNETPMVLDVDLTDDALILFRRHDPSEPT